MTQPQAAAWYVYAVLPAGAALPPALAPAVSPALAPAPLGAPPPGILPGAEPVLLQGLPGTGPDATDGVADLAALVSQVPRAVFTPDQPGSRAAEPEWIAARLAAHHAVVTRAAASGPCLPLGFGTLFGSVQAVQAWLAANRTVIRHALHELAGQVEWGLALTEDAAAHADWAATHDRGVQALAEAAAQAGPGTAYLLGRRVDKAAIQACASHTAAVAADLTVQLSSLARHHACVVQSGALRPREMAAWSLLVPPDIDPAAALDGIASDLAPTGLGLRLTGPFPPYGFARALWQEAAHV